MDLQSLIHVLANWLSTASKLEGVAFVGFMVDTLVMGAGFITWVLFLPQIRLLYTAKRSDTLSLGTVYGSFSVQTLVFIQALLKGNWQLAFLQGTSMFFLVIVIIMVHWYRRWPGGRTLLPRWYLSRRKSFHK